MADLHILDEKQEPPEILVVDDDAMVLDIVVESIKAAGLNADACEDGADALAKTEATHYDLILTDMKLPGLDGLSLIKRLKADNSDTDVIVITGYGSIENAVECMKAGAIDYIIKPFTVDQIQVAVRKALDHRELRKRALERELYRELSYLDPLTGIHNRRYFDEALEAETQKSLRHKVPLVLLMIDIDDFKQYQNNDHQRGDQALKKMAHLFKCTCRVYDVVTRFGGEEFAIIFPGAGLENSMEMAGRILQEVRDTYFPGEEQCPLGSLTVSIGVACFPEHSSSSFGLVRCADQALDEAKRRGKNNVQLWGSLH
jgi:diguanylate cyclase (GGDEF)-like protein